MEGVRWQPATFIKLFTNETERFQVVPLYGTDAERFNALSRLITYGAAAVFVAEGGDRVDPLLFGIAALAAQHVLMGGKDEPPPQAAAPQRPLIDASARVAINREQPPTFRSRNKARTGRFAMKPADLPPSLADTAVNANGVGTTNAPRAVVATTTIAEKLEGDAMKHAKSHGGGNFSTSSFVDEAFKAGERRTAAPLDAKGVVTSDLLLQAGTQPRALFDGDFLNKINRFPGAARPPSREPINPFTGQQRVAPVSDEAAVQKQ